MHARACGQPPVRCASVLKTNQTTTLTTSNADSTAHPYFSSTLHDSSTAIDKLIPSSSAFNDASSYARDQHYSTPARTTAMTSTTTAIVSQSYQNHHSPPPLTSGGTYSGSMGHLPALGSSGLSASKQLQSSSQSGGQRVQSSLGQGHELLQQYINEMRQIEDTVDSIEIPARGRCKVYMAKYGYDPFKQSPNDNPDAELAFNAGDYIMVFDEADEDGYFIGELMDGRRGYVPSNWLDRLTGEDLFDFQATVLYQQAGLSKLGGANGTGTGGIGSVIGGGGGTGTAVTGGTAGLMGGGLDEELDSNSYPPEFYDAIVGETMNHSNFQHLLAPEDYHRMNDYVDLDDVNEVDDECLSDYERAEAEQMRRAVPPPQRLILERQLNKCILIAWLHPQSAKGTIVSYQVYVDGVLKSTVPSGDRTKALLEGVDSNIPHRISVRAIDIHGRHSNDAGCTIVMGQKIPFAPSCVRASHITSDSALISWLPCNSNFHHVVAVNSVEVQTVRPGVYKHLINGLTANTLYRVWVRAKPGKILSVDEKNPKKLESLTTYVDFKTMPKSLPDPPVNVQVEAGPQRRTLLVTWLPLTLNDYGSSNGCAVTGYAVFAGHKKLADIDSPTGDHALLDVADLESLHKKSVTVRTKSGENLSQDSMPCHIPDEYLKTASKSDALNNQHHHQHHQQVSSAHNQQRHSAMQHAHRLSESNLTHSIGRNISPSSRHPRDRNLHAARNGDQHHFGQQQHQRAVATTRYNSINRGRQMTRSLQNLESDLDSRRSSIPAIEITRETSGSDMINPTESYSEEEFESSMRIRGGVARGRSAISSTGRQGLRYRTRQSHSVDSTSNVAAHYNQSQAMNRTTYHQSQLAAARAGPRGTSALGDVRYFVALFDYDPSTMSPNPNAASEELAFKEGSVIRIYGNLGDDGFYKGEIDNQVGFVPCNVITEITDPNILNNLYEKNHPHLPSTGASQNRQLIQGASNLHQSVTPAQANSNLASNQLIDQVQQRQGQPAQQQPSQQQQSGVKRMTALYDYDPQENSPNADTESEIPFRVGDVIYVYGKMDTDGFYMGEVERTKQRGLVPSNFLREDQSAMKVQAQSQQFNHQAGGNQMIDQFQQQRQLNQNQFVGNAPIQSQPQQMDMNSATGGAFGQNVQMQQLNKPQQQQQQQQMNNVQQMRGNIRGVLPPPQQNHIGPQNAQQNINRPTTLSLGAGGGTQQHQQHQQQMLMHQQNSQMNIGGLQQNMRLQDNSFAPLMNPQQQGVGQFGNSGGMIGGGMMSASGQQQFQQQQQQQQLNANQPAGGGVLSNLLSSGKQMIGAAATPRNPSQPGQFIPSMNTANQMGNQMNMNSGNMNMGPAGTGNAIIADGGHFQANRTNIMQSTNPALAAFNLAPGEASHLQHQHNQHLQGNNSFALAGNNPAQQHSYNQMGGGMNRVGGIGSGVGGGGGGGTMNQIGEEQGGNILNTVKNMFKL